MKEKKHILQRRRPSVSIVNLYMHACVCVVTPYYHYECVCVRVVVLQRKYKKGTPNVNNIYA